MDENTNSIKESQEGTTEEPTVPTLEGIEPLTHEEVTSILLAVITLLDKANPDAQIHERVTIMAEAIYEKIYEQN